MTKPDLKPADGAVPIENFVADAATAIKASSLLARKPELATAQLTMEQWQAELDADQATPTDADQAPATD